MIDFCSSPYPSVCPIQLNHPLPEHSPSQSTSPCCLAAPWHASRFQGSIQAHPKTASDPYRGATAALYFWPLVGMGELCSLLPRICGDQPATQLIQPRSTGFEPSMLVVVLRVVLVRSVASDYQETNKSSECRPKGSLRCVNSFTTASIAVISQVASDITCT